MIVFELFTDGPGWLVAGIQLDTGNKKRLIRQSLSYQLKLLIFLPFFDFFKME